MSPFSPSRLAVCAALSLLGLSLAPTAIAQSYSFTDLGTLGGMSSTATAINNAGQVAGWAYTTGNAAQHATMWEGGTVTDLGQGNAYAINNVGQVVGFAGSGLGHATQWQKGGPTVDLYLAATYGVGSIFYTFTGAYAINDAGKVAGNSYVNTGAPSGYGPFANHASLYGGGVIDLNGSPTLAMSSSSATAINNNQVAGYGVVNSGYQHAILWSGWSTLTNSLIPTDLGTLSGGNNSTANAINNAGQVVGWSQTMDQSIFMKSHATLWDGGTAIDLGTLGGYNSTANAINNAGQIVGGADVFEQGVTGRPHAALWQGGILTDLNSFLDASAIGAGWVLTNAKGINDMGWIVGDARNSFTNETHGFLLSVNAVPEPETYAMMLAGLGLLGFMARRRRQQAA